MHKVKEVIVVEGRYDKNALSQVVDAVIIETSGFGIFNNTQKQKLLRTMAEKRGLIVMTDSDGAGFVIRNFIKSCVDAFAKAKGLSRRTAFNYLNINKGVSLLVSCYDVEITLPLDEILNDLTMICQRNGGEIK